MYAWLNLFRVPVEGEFQARQLPDFLLSVIFDLERGFRFGRGGFESVKRPGAFVGSIVRFVADGCRMDANYGDGEWQFLNYVGVPGNVRPVF